MYTLLPNTAGDDHTKWSGFDPTKVDHSTAPVRAFNAYIFESPPPTYITDVAAPIGTSELIVGVLTTPASEGSEQYGGDVVPRKVCQLRLPEVSVARS